MEVILENIDALALNDANRIDELESKLQAYPAVQCPLEHVFTPGLYSRTIFMPYGMVITSLIHKTEHQFAITQGSAFVRDNEGKWNHLVAPYRGKTLAGTRRVLFIDSEVCVWTTYHATDICPQDESREEEEKAVTKITDRIIEQHINPYLGGIIKNNIISKIIDKPCLI